VLATKNNDLINLLEGKRFEIRTMHKKLVKTTAVMTSFEICVISVNKDIPHHDPIERKSAKYEKLSVLEI